MGGSGPAGGDLYAVRTDGGPVIPVTFTSVGEMRPALSPDGGMVAFLRGASLRDSTPGTVWVMNLLSGAERELELPRGARRAQPGGLDCRWAVSWWWRRAAGSIAVRRHRPERRRRCRCRRPSGPRRESTLAVLLGRPVFARVVPCAEPGALCVAG